MNQPYQFELINGTFSVPEAREILLDMINKKINFHQMRNFSTEERTGEPNYASLQRIEELQKSKVDLLYKLEEAALLNTKIHVRSVTSLAFEEALANV